MTDPHSPFAPPPWEPAEGAREVPRPVDAVTEPAVPHPPAIPSAPVALGPMPPLTGDVPARELPTGEFAASAEAPPRARRARVAPPLGHIALITVLVLIALEVIGIVLAVERQYAAATIIGQAVILLTAVPFLLGLTAAIARWGRSTGVAAAVLAVLANPLVLNALLDLFS